MTLQDKKKWKLREIMIAVKQAEKQGKLVSEEKLISEMIMMFGAARVTIKDYLRTLEAAGKIRRINGLVCTKEEVKEESEEKNTRKD